MVDLMNAFKEHWKAKKKTPAADDCKYLFGEASSEDSGSG